MKSYVGAGLGVRRCGFLLLTDNDVLSSSCSLVELPSEIFWLEVQVLEPGESSERVSLVIGDRNHQLPI